jgi:hypothetical protein
VSQATAAQSNEPEGKPLLVVDLGRRSKKQIKRLRKGNGRLMERVVDTVEMLQQDGTVESDAQIVVVVVKQDDDRKGLFF